MKGDKLAKMRLKDGRTERASEFWGEVARMGEDARWHDCRLVCMDGGMQGVSKFSTLLVFLIFTNVSC